MNVVKSSVTGYCFGVSRTISMAAECIDSGVASGRPYYSIGQLIHNKDAVSFFEKKGLKVISSPNGVPAGIALVRAHGIGDGLRREFLESGFEIIDSTCPNIVKTRREMKKAADSGRLVIVVGVDGHAEVRCLMDTDGTSPVFISSVKDAACFCNGTDGSVPVSCFVQTTFQEALYDEILCILRSHFMDFIAGSSLCSSCIERKKAALDIALKTDAVVVVGGRNSENSLELARIISEIGRPVFFVENADDIDDSVRSAISGLGSIGLCSGTSVPGFVIDGVESVLRSI